LLFRKKGATHALSRCVASSLLRTVRVHLEKIGQRAECTVKKCQADVFAETLVGKAGFILIFVDL
jgi:hypothetical protein